MLQFVGRGELYLERNAEQKTVKLKIEILATLEANVALTLDSADW